MAFVYRYVKDYGYGSEPVYVGRTINLKTRHASHMNNDKWCNDSLRLEYMDVPSNAEADALESYFIGKYISEGYNLYNKSKTWDGKSSSKHITVNEDWEIFSVGIDNSIKSFKKWIKQFIGEDSEIGDLADDIYRDNEFPSSKKFEDHLRYLRRKTDHVVLMSFYDAWNDYDFYKECESRKIKDAKNRAEVFVYPVEDQQSGGCPSWGMFKNVTIKYKKYGVAEDSRGFRFHPVSHEELDDYKNGCKAKLCTTEQEAEDIQKWWILKKYGSETYSEWKKISDDYVVKRSAEPMSDENGIPIPVNLDLIPITPVIEDEMYFKYIRLGGGRK